MEFDHAPFGVIGVETLLPVAYTELCLRHRLPLSQVLEKMTVNPARVLGLYKEWGSLEAGKRADVVAFDVERARRIDARRFQSKSRNTPFDGREVHGTPVHVVVGGRPVVVDGVLQTA